MYANVLIRVLKYVIPAVLSLIGKSSVVDMKDNPKETVFRAIAKSIGTKNLALGVTIATGLETGLALYSKPGLHASVESLIKEIISGSGENGEYPVSVENYADEIEFLFKKHNLKPNRLAIDGIVGCGKSTLSLALARKLGMRWQSLDHMNMDKPIDFSAENTIYEHHRLLRTQNIDCFDAIIYIDEPIEISKERILNRKRGGYLVDILDFEKHKRVGKMAFNVADGVEIAISDSFIKIKLRPKDGFKSHENIVAELKKKGIKAENISKEELLFLCTEHEVCKGFLAYVNADAYTKEILTGVASGLRQLAK
ncbi:MAG: hypothetical protein HQK88_03600 [Nitrospirae bacterium]|nr:hypothetical protein [Nitrospirota bacterium]MBF0534199.1 hypothetical protein [Nitrospirota bacterium]MBF0615887.1 hypothetical protein [Nitrospirota bacterium]